MSLSDISGGCSKRYCYLLNELQITATDIVQSSETDAYTAPYSSTDEIRNVFSDCFRMGSVTNRTEVRRQNVLELWSQYTDDSVSTFLRVRVM